MGQWEEKIQDIGGERRKRGRVTEREKQYYLVRWLHALWGATLLQTVLIKDATPLSVFTQLFVRTRLDFSLSTVWAPGGCLSRGSSLTCCAKRAHNTHLFNDSMNEWMNSNLDPTTRFYGTKRLCHELQHCLLGEKWPFVQLFIFSVFSFCIFFSFRPNKIKHGSSDFQPNPFKKYCSLM